jgi:aminoacyl tRNA synthase complex-interacting multifunctional protein 1
LVVSAIDAAEMSSTMSLAVTNSPASLFIQIVVALIPQANQDVTVVTEDVQEPQLRLGEKTITGSHAICTYLCTKYPTTLLGTSVNDEGLVWQWLSFCRSSQDRLSRGQLFTVHAWLARRNFLVGTALTLADLAVFAAVYPQVDSMSHEDRLACVNLVRWFDHVQWHVRHANVCPHVAISYDFPVEIKPFTSAASGKEESKEKKEKKEEKSEGASKTEKPAAEKAKKEDAKVAVEGEKKAQKKEEPKEGEVSKDEQKKEKKEKKEKNKEEKVAAPAVEEVYEVDKMDIRVGRIVTVKRHPDADSLYVEEIDVGEEKPRQIVSGLVKFVPIEEMQNRMVIVICNLKPAKMRGIESFGMVMAASDEAHTKVELLKVPEAAKPGERVQFEGFSGAADKQVNPKKVEGLLSGFKTDANGTPNYKGKLFMTSAGAVGATIPNGNVR